MVGEVNNGSKQSKAAHCGDRRYKVKMSSFEVDQQAG
jgi:hypothetical protein